MVKELVLCAFHLFNLNENLYFKGVIVQKREQKPSSNGEVQDELLT